jgi:hypothetical protein
LHNWTVANVPGRSCDRSISTGEATKSRDRSKLEVVVGKLGIGKVGVGKLGIGKVGVGKLEVEVGDAGDAVFNTL